MRGLPSQPFAAMHQRRQSGEAGDDGQQKHGVEHANVLRVDHDPFSIHPTPVKGRYGMWGRRLRFLYVHSGAGKKERSFRSCKAERTFPLLR